MPDPLYPTNTKVWGMWSDAVSNWWNNTANTNKIVRGIDKFMRPAKYSDIPVKSLNVMDNPAIAMLSGGPAFKYKSFGELGSLKESLGKSVSGTVHSSKNGRMAFSVNKAPADPKYVPTMSVAKPKKTYNRPATIVIGGEGKPPEQILKENPNAYVEALNRAQEAAAAGYDDLATWWYEYASKLNPRKDSFKSRFLWGELYKQGGILSAKSGIHIKKKNRGKFTSWCGGKVTSECIARGKASSNPTIRKRATFAANARKWKHQNGGKIMPFWVHNMLGK